MKISSISIPYHFNHFIICSCDPTKVQRCQRTSGGQHLHGKGADVQTHGLQPHQTSLGTQQTNYHLTGLGRDFVAEGQAERRQTAPFCHLWRERERMTMHVNQYRFNLPVSNPSRLIEHNSQIPLCTKGTHILQRNHILHYCVLVLWYSNYLATYIRRFLQC